MLISRKNGIKITETFKHLTCRLEEKLYCLESEPEGEIDPPVCIVPHSGYIYFDSHLHVLNPAMKMNVLVCVHRL